MHAVSDDLINWTKIPDEIWVPDESIYEKQDWRDPCIFWYPDILYDYYRSSEGGFDDATLQRPHGQQDVD